MSDSNRNFQPPFYSLTSIPIHDLTEEYKAKTRYFQQITSEERKASFSSTPPFPLKAIEA